MANQSPPTENHVRALEKRCKECAAVKPASQFYKDKSLRDGLRSRCKPCEQDVERMRRGQPPRNLPLRVDLLVCPTCKHVGKLPPTFGYRGYCLGVDQSRHPKAKMQSRLFVEVLNG